MKWKHHELRLFGHRGASSRLPENTLEAFQRALDDGANALELDVHLTRDRRLVVAHDPDGRRTANRPERIRDITVEELKGWNVAAGFADLSDQRLMVPTLSEVFAAFPDAPIVMDLKSTDRGVAQVCLTTVRNAGAEHRTTVGSFHGQLIHRLRRHGYRGPTSLTRGEVAVSRFLPVLAIQKLVNGRAAMIPPRHRSIRLDGRGFIDRCRRVGLRVDYWVVNDLNVARTLVSHGATGIVTDDPRRLTPVLAEFG